MLAVGFDKVFTALSQMSIQWLSTNIKPINSIDMDILVNCAVGIVILALANIMFNQNKNIFKKNINNNIQKENISMENPIEQIILNLSNSFEENSRNENTKLINTLKNRFKNNEELYECEITLAFMNFTDFAALPWLEENPQITNGWDKFYIESIYNGLLSHYLRKVIEKNEGSPFSGDKEHFIIKSLKKAIATGENISLQVFYDEKDGVPVERIGAKAYWSPSSFIDTDDVKAKFKAWYEVI